MSKGHIWLPVAAILAGACDADGAHVIPESAAIAIAREEFGRRGIDAALTDRVIEGLELCLSDTPCRTVTLALDGWDPARTAGFAYITAADRGGSASTAVERDEAEALQVLMDGRAASEGVVLVFREWAHETQLLAEEQFRNAVRAALDAHGL